MERDSAGSAPALDRTRRYFAPRPLQADVFPTSIPTTYIMLEDQAMRMSELDSRGRVVLPVALRAELGLKPGSRVEFERVAEGLLVRPLRPITEILPRLCGAIPKDHPSAYEDPLGLKGIWE